MGRTSVKLLSLLTQAVVTSGLCAQTAPSFKPGHYYVPNYDGEVLEFDEELNEVDRFIVKDVVGSTGATFNDQGNLVFIARVRDAGNHVLEVDREGQIVHDYQMRGGPLLNLPTHGGHERSIGYGLRSGGSPHGSGTEQQERQANLHA